MSFLDRIRPCRRLNPAHFRPFAVGGLRVGWVKHDFARVLAGFPEVFTVAAERVDVRGCIDGFEARSEAVGGVLRRLARRGDLPAWRSEVYPVVTRWGADPLLVVDRAAVPCLGVPAFGLHVNGYVAPDGPPAGLWVARRAATSYTDPGKLDHLVAGGQPWGLGLRENLAKEADEEAGILPTLAAQALPVGVFAYRQEIEWGLRNDTIFMWDLALPGDFTPRNLDGEVEAFELWPIERVMEVLSGSDAFKFNVGPVIIDFLVRHGRLGPEEPDYLEIVRALHAPA